MSTSLFTKIIILCYYLFRGTFSLSKCHPLIFGLILILINWYWYSKEYHFFISTIMNNRRISIIVRFKSKIHLYSLFLTIITSFLEKEDDTLIKCSIYYIRNKKKNSPSYNKKRLIWVFFILNILLLVLINHLKYILVMNNMYHY